MNKNTTYLASMADALDLFEPGNTLYIPGASSEPRALVEALASAAQDMNDLHVVSGFVSGINNIPLADDGNRIRETVFFPRPKQHALAHKIHLLPLTYYGINNYLAACDFDWAIVQVSPPNPQGQCSLGVSAEFQCTAITRARRILAVINRHMPFLPNSPHLHLGQFDCTVEEDFPLISYDTGEVDAVSNRIAAHLAELIEPYSVIQTGLGKVPDKLLANLSDQKNLRFHSGMISDGFITLLDSGALDPDFAHTTCCALGSSDFYRRLANIDGLTIKGVDVTHAPRTLAAMDHLVAINSGLEVDLFGQANLEMASGRQVSNVGGAADFARFASVGKQGKSIIALPATAGKGKFSRIVTSLGTGTMTSLPRYDVDYVVTEFGIAELKNRSLPQRAAALAAIAAPEFRDALLATGR
ncbi:MAG: acetyl-CoA hydrolase/transferase C-terminal domain-containing protein [Porticoccaceae bacterium]